ncbi:YidH family protein [Terrilactibacillus laevilacticus]|uniref:YidH family protein n=1 Tax=Terrilactibacillus laevilacticus TaxID=1380157 RepID=A0ABW5PPC4_9BACI|nr:DUF202 domain-containing protein [Terrilactibacillus laevilacticus]
MRKDNDNNKKDHKLTNESKYIQQHLANERTFLAWIRTAIAIIGVGFLVTNLHFNMRSSLSPLGDLLADLIGLSSVGLGILTIMLAIFSYFKKVITINDQNFQTPKITIILLGFFVILIALIFGIYFLIL